MPVFSLTDIIADHVCFIDRSRNQRNQQKERKEKMQRVMFLVNQRRKRRRRKIEEYLNN
jgi:hypothetical protein